MGNTTSNADFECCIEAKDFKLIKKIKDKHFGEISHMKGNKTEDIVLMKELEFPDQDTYHNMIEDYSYYTSLRHNNLATIYGFTGADNHELFKNTSHKICIYFEYLQNTLESVLSKKKVQLASGNKQGSPENFYGELEMFKMMSYLVNPLEYLQQNGVSHGDIRPSSCFIDNKGNIKLYNRKLLCEKETAFHKAKNGDNTLFLTPFEFECLGKQKSEPVQDQYKADVFRLGMTLMECATLKKSVQIYDWNNYTMNLNILSVRLLEVKQRYSPFIYEMLREMLRFEESKRPDFATLKHYLIEEGKTNLSLVSVHHVDEEDHLLKELIMGMESKTVLPSRSNSSGERYNAFFQKSIANSGSSKPEPKRIPIGETPQLTKETARDYAACSIPSTYREENIQEDLLESQPHVKINEIQNQSLVPVSKKFRTMNCDLTSILMNTSASEIRANPHIGAGVIERKTPEADLSILSKKGVDDMQEVSQVVIESPESKSRDTPVLSLNSPVVIEDTYSSYKKDTSNPVHMKDYPSLGRYGGSSAIYEKHSSHQNYALDISAAMAKADMIQQKIQESLERARKCRESIYKGDVKDQLNSSTATFGADNHDMVNEKLYSSEYRYSTGRDTKRPSSRASLVQPGSATRDSRAKSSGRSTIYKYQSAKKEPIPSLFDSTYRPEISEQSIENSDPCPFTPVFSAGKGKRSVSSNRGIKRVADPYDIIPERENSSAIPIQKILSIATPEKLRNYSEMYERNLRLSDLKKEASTEEFDSESSPWNNLHLLEQEQSNNLSKQVELLRHADPQTEETFQKAMERTQQTREVIKMIEAKSRASLAKKGLYII